MNKIIRFSITFFKLPSIIILNIYNKLLIILNIIFKLLYVLLK